MIHLTDNLIIGVGRDRTCYQHPDNSDLCIKVPHRREKQTRRERLYFSLLRWQKKNTSQLSEFRGMTATDQGKGALFDLIKDSAGNVSYTVTEAIQKHAVSSVELDLLLDELHLYLTSNHICLRDLSPNNVVIQVTDGAKQLIIIDGVSNPGVSPLNFFWKPAITRSLNKAWKSMIYKTDKTKKDCGLT